MIIEKEKSQFGTDVYISEGDSYLTIFYGGNGDLYWTIHSKNRSIENDPKKDCFYITKENYKLFHLFNKLYDDIKEINIYDDFKEDKSKYRKYNQSNYNELFDGKNKTITWYSDETAHDVANYLVIKKEKDAFKLDFNIQEPKENYSRDFNSLYYIPIRICNSGSRYYPFNIPFMNMYNALVEFDDEKVNGHQICMEEYLYERGKQKVLKKQ